MGQKILEWILIILLFDKSKIRSDDIFLKNDTAFSLAIQFDI